MDSAPDELVTLWDAYYQLEPFGGEYHRHAAQMEILESIFAMLANRNVPSDRRDLLYKPRNRRQFFPPDYAGEVLKRKAKAKIDDQLNHYVDVIARRKA